MPYKPKIESKQCWISDIRLRQRTDDVGRCYNGLIIKYSCYNTHAAWFSCCYLVWYLLCKFHAIKLTIARENKNKYWRTMCVYVRLSLSCIDFSRMVRRKINQKMPSREAICGSCFSWWFLLINFIQPFLEK